MTMMRYPVIDVVGTGANITRLRKLRGYSAAEVAVFMSMPTPAAVYKWERGASLPTVDHLFALSRLLEVTMNDIIIESGGSQA